MTQVSMLSEEHAHTSPETPNMQQVVACFHCSYSQGFKGWSHTLISSHCAIRARVSRVCGCTEVRRI